MGMGMGMGMICIVYRLKLVIIIKKFKLTSNPKKRPSRAFFIPLNPKTLPKIFLQNTRHITLSKSGDKYIRIDASATGN